MKLIFVISILTLFTGCILDEAHLAQEEVMSNHSDGGSEVIEATPTIPVRPTDALTINSSFCSCISQKTDFTGGDACSSYCAGAPNSTTPTLYGSVTPGNEITQHEDLGNLYNWCNVELLNEYGEGDSAPSCVFRVSDGLSTTDLPITIPSGANTFTVNLSALETNKIYLAHIVEVKSEATSSYIQFERKEQDDDEDTYSGPLLIMPMSQYSCLTRSGSISTEGSEFYEEALRLHYYYAYNETPDALPPGNQMTICHDPRIPEQGDNDSPLYPRFELVQQAFYVWNKADLRFYDVNPQNNKLDVNDLIQEKLLDTYGISQSIDIFQEFSWPNSPVAQESQFSGYYMQPWINTSTGRGFCPGYEQFNSGNPLFAVIRDVLGGIETEAIYLALRQAATIYDGDGNEVTAPNDILIVRESDLKEVWFYKENNTYYTPTEVTAGQRTVHFYYPFDPENPWVQKSQQYLYTVRTPEDITTSIASSSASGLRTTIVAPDKRFGCIPKHDHP